MEWLSEIVNWLFVGIYDFVTEVFAYALEWLVIAKIKMMIFVTTFMWHVAENVINNIGISDLLNNSWASLDSEFLTYASVFRIPDCLNVLVQAVVTRFSLRFVL